MISKIFSLRNYVIKQLTKTNKKGIMQIPDKGKIDFGEMIIKENLFKKGIDHKTITSSKQLDNILNTPTIPPHSTPKKSGEVIQFPEDRITDWTKPRPTKKAYGGVAGLLGEPTYEDENHRVPYKDAKLVEGETYLPPKNSYSLGLGPLLNEFMSEDRPRDEGGSHTTLNKKDLVNLWNYLKKDQDIDIEDELMFRFNRMNPEKKSQFHVGLGKDKAEIGFKKNIDFNKWLMGKADGGRIGLKDGSKMSRRGFLKILGGLATIPLVGKYFKWAKPLAKSSKVLTSVPIKSGVDGMPLWFKPLVNKVIKEGEQVKVTEYDRLITHKTKLPNSKTDVYVNQDLNNGDVWVDIGVEKHGFADGKFGQPVRLEYKAGEILEPNISKTGKVKSKGGKTKEEFWVEEAEFTGGHPENVKFEESSFNKFGKHESDFSEVEAFATGKTKKTRNISSLQKQDEDLADHFSNYPEPDDFASGGVAEILGE